MTRPEKTKPHGGNREASEITTAWTSDSGAKHSAEAAALFLALSATDAARGQLDRLAVITADPLPGIVDAADLLEAARELLAQGVTP